MPMSNMRKSISSFLNPTANTLNLLTEVQSQRERIKNLKSEYDALSDWNRQYVLILESVTDSINALIWKKDEDYRHVLSNPAYCNIFLGQVNFTLKCLDFIVGKTTSELIDQNFEDHKITSTFNKIVEDSDELTKENGKVTNFLEAGKVNGKDLLLYTIKTPQFDDDGKFTGIIGIAWDITNHSKFMIKQLNRWIYSGSVNKIIHEKNVFCYEISSELSKCEIFNHICPNPRRGKSCINDCEDCIEHELYKGEQNDREH